MIFEILFIVVVVVVVVVLGLIAREILEGD